MGMYCTKFPKDFIFKFRYLIKHSLMADKSRNLLDITASFSETSLRYFFRNVSQK